MTETVHKVCPYTKQEVELYIDKTSIPGTMGYKTMPGPCSDENCPYNETPRCKLFLSLIGKLKQLALFFKKITGIIYPDHFFP